MMQYKKTRFILDDNALEMFRMLRDMEQTALRSRGAIYKRYAKLCCVKPHEISIDDKTGVVSVIETN